MCAHTINIGAQTIGDPYHYEKELYYDYHQ
jgi:hypothetical protein